MVTNMNALIRFQSFLAALTVAAAALFIARPVVAAEPASVMPPMRSSG